ncbi:MAG TPA: ROK family protein [Gillisia sp.]|nr:ROK family protein [Gillisia sp.]
MESKMKIIGLDIGGTKIHIGEVQDGIVLKDLKLSTSAGAPKNQVLDEIVLGIERVMTKDAAGIGVGVPGLVDEGLGVVYNVQNIPSWNKVFLKDYLEDHFNKPVYITNDANTFAAGEKMYGKGRCFQNFVGITLGTGLGTGIIINNQVYSGSFSGAGEYGGIPYLNKTLEDYCSGKFFQQEMGISGNKVMILAEQGDKRALETFKKFGIHIGSAIKILLFSISPEAIFLGGSISKCYKHFEESMLKSIDEFPYKIITQNLVIERSVILNGSVLGAAALFAMRYENENSRKSLP